MGTSFWEICCAVILPPAGVLIKTGCSIDLLVNVLLTILGYIPGVIHAIYIVSRPEPEVII
ncbi:hypothetical protein MIR68_001205 [Amoeboaphelidium protococcarum]|nr:hypothetical protein MIR68_001205 [Amoeboaphelidium protococcarum]